ncbi:MAG: hypothetical protein KA802_13205 [Saprospiraceae bacterium]|nr:hypothetical protein [Saprospiraceae bacterium]
MEAFFKFVTSSKCRIIGIILILLGISGYGLIIGQYSLLLLVEFIFFSFTTISIILGLSLLITHVVCAHINKISNVKKEESSSESWQTMKGKIQ